MNNHNGTALKMYAETITSENCVSLNTRYPVYRQSVLSPFGLVSETQDEYNNTKILTSLLPFPDTPNSNQVSVHR